MKNVSFLAVIALTALSFLSVSAQQRASDTIIVQTDTNIITKNNDSLLVLHYKQLSDYYLDKKPDSSVYWAEKILSFALVKNNRQYQQYGLQALKQAEASIAKVQTLHNDLSEIRLSKQNKIITFLLIALIVTFIAAVVVTILSIKKTRNIKTLEINNIEHVEIIKNIESDIKTLEKQNAELKKEQQEMQAHYTMLVKSNEIKDKLIPMIAHDIRAPLASLQNTLVLTRDNIITPEEFNQLSSALEGDVFNLRGMLDNMLLWAREQMFEVKINKAKFDVSEIFKEVILMNRNSLVNKNITLHNYIPQTLEVNSDREIISVVVRNLLSNAIKFTEPGKNIYISQIFFKQKAYISVRDEGKGIDGEILQKLTNKQLATTRGTANEKGTGLGLIFSSEMLAKLEEAFDITSAVNKGTSVTFSVATS